MSGTTAAAVVSVDGVVTPLAEARVAAMDHGFLFGDSIYEVIRTRSGRPVAFAQHLERLRQSANAIYLQLPWTDAELTSQIRQAVQASRFEECYVRLVVSRGSGPMTLMPDACTKPVVVVYVLPLVLPTQAEIDRGVSVAIPTRLRNDLRALAPAAKTGNYLNNVLALVEARRAGADDAVMLNCDGHVTESTTANVFWVKGGEVRTPSLECGILAGITRTLLIWAMRQEGISVVEGRFHAADLREADEAFLTGTIRGVSPVVRIDGLPVGEGVPGETTRRIIALNDRVLEAHTQDW
jgi:branched-chain amino acid aminotransferase